MRDIDETRLSAYLDGELLEDERLQVEQLLQSNPESKKLLSELTEVRSYVRSLSQEQLRSDIVDSVIARAAAMRDNANDGHGGDLRDGILKSVPSKDSASAHAGSSIPKSNRNFRKLAWSAAAIAAMAACILLVFRTQPRAAISLSMREQAEPKNHPDVQFKHNMAEQGSISSEAFAPAQPPKAMEDVVQQNLGSEPRFREAAPPGGVYSTEPSLEATPGNAGGMFRQYQTPLEKERRSEPLSSSSILGTSGSPESTGLSGGRGLSEGTKMQYGQVSDAPEGSLLSSNAPMPMSMSIPMSALPLDKFQESSTDHFDNRLEFLLGRTVSSEQISSLEEALSFGRVSAFLPSGQAPKQRFDESASESKDRDSILNPMESTSQDSRILQLSQETRYLEIENPIETAKLSELPIVPLQFMDTGLNSTSSGGGDALIQEESLERTQPPELRQLDESTSTLREEVNDAPRYADHYIFVELSRLPEFLELIASRESSPGAYSIEMAGGEARQNDSLLAAPSEDSIKTITARSKRDRDESLGPQVARAKDASFHADRPPRLEQPAQITDWILIRLRVRPN